MSSLTDLAISILVNSKKLDDYAQEKGLSTSSEDRPDWRNAPAEIEKARLAVEDAADSLKRVARQPGAFLYEQFFRYTDISVMQFLYYFKIPQLIPKDGSMSYDEIASAIEVQKVVIQRFIQNAIVIGYFKEDPTTSRVSHTADSKALANDPLLFESLGMILEEIMPAFLNAVPALRKWPLSLEINETGFTHANNTTKTMYETFETDPLRAKRFGGAMSVFNREAENSLPHLLSHPTWSALDARPSPALVVDLGGSLGHLSIALARITKNTTFEVQDLPKTVDAATKAAPAELTETGRLRFKAHDFLTPQDEAKGGKDVVDVFLVAQVFQNWPDKKVAQIVRNLLPRMRRGSKVLVHERMVPEWARETNEGRRARSGDMLMGSLLNGMIRTPKQWGAVFKEADARFGEVSFNTVNDRGLIEVTLEG
ncbi:S-adenosyl-L-methionine-dependent methyltransferase [Elsinoe ampelina]|uniref:S-adenosyl-L-methionine-dependent methyltransferase n=1 Tax=Elsinoe ampelina TaxID=302913 RepID=A0A6A6GQH8_9PEZI|nr:S-adenosyl-L-methionine-dependent methyltransferase [Elsinoe ampelina]